jgi:hypothetical protein
MTKFQVTVKVEAKPDYTVTVDAETEGKAKSKAMTTYPHKLRGDFVEYVVVTAN